MHEQTGQYSWNVLLSDIPYSQFRFIYMLRLCAVGFVLRNIHDIFL